MTIYLRKATLDDVPNILEIVNYSILNTTAIYDYDRRSLAQQNDWFLAKQKSNHPVIVAEIDNEIAGFGTFGEFRVKVAYQFTVEHSVYVAEKFKGRGAGKLLLSELIALAKLDGYHAMIGCIDAQNGTSVGFHEKFGFEVCGTLREVGYKFDRWLDLVIMQRILK